MTDFFYKFFEVKILLDFTTKKNNHWMQDSMPTIPLFTSQAIAIPPSHSLDVLDKIFQLIGYWGTMILTKILKSIGKDQY